MKTVQLQTNNVSKLVSEGPPWRGEDPHAPATLAVLNSGENVTIVIDVCSNIGEKKKDSSLLTDFNLIHGMRGSLQFSFGHEFYTAWITCLPALGPGRELVTDRKLWDTWVALVWAKLNLCIYTLQTILITRSAERVFVKLHWDIFLRHWIFFLSFFFFFLE